MDELELLKKDWQKDTVEYPKLTAQEIYPMLLKKSSSLVKWIFIISLLEFAFWSFISFAFKDSDAMTRFEEYNVEYILVPLSIIGYIILFYFFYMFFKNYRRINTTDNAKTLMETILKTRRTVKQYVIFNLVFLVISTFVSLWIVFNNDMTFIKALEEAAVNGSTFKVYATTILATVLALTVAIGLILLFYYLIYGILLKRLNRNYKELKKLDF
jgi:magnesium-transporting ATPase (P-type)